MVTELKELPRAESRSAGWRASSPAAFAISSRSLNIGTPARSMVANHSALPGNDGRSVDQGTDHGKVDRRIDSGDRGHRFVTEYCAALGLTGTTRPP